MVASFLHAFLCSPMFYALNFIPSWVIFFYDLKVLAGTKVKPCYTFSEDVM